MDALIQLVIFPRAVINEGTNVHIVTVCIYVEKQKDKETKMK